MYCFLSNDINIVFNHSFAGHTRYSPAPPRLIFKYSPIKNTKKQFSSKILKKENPFNVLKNINFK